MVGGNAGDVETSVPDPIRGLTIADSTFATLTGDTVSLTVNARGGMGSLVHSGDGGAGGGGPGGLTTTNAGGSGSVTNVDTYDDTNATSVTYNSNTIPPPNLTTQDGATIAGTSGT